MKGGLESPLCINTFTIPLGNAQDYDTLLELSRQYQTISDYLMAFASDKETFAAFYRKDIED